MSQKHYHNDYKKQMGIDESRTASQKLLDKAISNRAPLQLLPRIQQDAPKKKVKKQRDENQQIKAQQIVRKIVKSISINNNVLKIQKGLSILEKCLSEEEFRNNLGQKQIVAIVQTLIENPYFPNGTLNEVIKIKDSEIKVLECINSIIDKKYSKTTEVEQIGKKIKLIGYKIQLEVPLLKLITDDSFSFAKDTASFKSKLFALFDNKEKIQEKEQQQNEQQKQIQEKLREFGEKFTLSKLLVLPNIHLEWVRTGITSLLKQFVILYKQQLKSPKQFLIEYNKFLQGKKSTFETATSDIMGSKRVSTGGSYSVIETQDSASAWCKRQ